MSNKPKTLNQAIQKRLDTHKLRVISNHGSSPFSLKHRAFKEECPEIPEEDLRILRKIYHKRYDNCGRKRGALLRYIKHFRETEDPTSLMPKLQKGINQRLKKKGLIFET